MVAGEQSRYEECKKQIHDTVRQRIDLSREVTDAEIQDMIDDGQEIEVNCHFCNKKHTFSIEELKALYRKSRLP